MKTRRYQLKKDAVGVVDRGHPWIFREQLSSAADIFGDGDWLRLVDGLNRVIGHGMFETEGAIAIRILRRGPDRPDAAWLRGQLGAALDKREPLLDRTDGIRLLGGESDGIPAVVVDRFGDDLVISSYSAGADAIARYLARVLAAEAQGLRGEAPSARARAVGPARSISLRPAKRRHSAREDARALRGTPPEIARFFEGPLTYAVDLAQGQKTGAYLDLRGLRTDLLGEVADREPADDDDVPDVDDGPSGPIANDQRLAFLDASGPVGTTRSGAVTIKERSEPVAAPEPSAVPSLRDARVLNLFSYTGMLGLAAESAGAEHVMSVDASERALAFAAEYHVVERERHTFVTADVFEWLPALSPAEQFDLVIVDPPSMTSVKSKVPGALAAYRKLYKAAATHVRPGGSIVAACCTSRIERAEFHHAVSEALGHRFKKVRELTPEPDHPVGFPQADYLKIAWWRRTS